MNPDVYREEWDELVAISKDNQKRLVALDTRLDEKEKNDHIWKAAIGISGFIVILISLLLRESIVTYNGAMILITVISVLFAINGVLWFCTASFWHSLDDDEYVAAMRKYSGRMLIGQVTFMLSVFYLYFKIVDNAPESALDGIVVTCLSIVVFTTMVSLATKLLSDCNPHGCCGAAGPCSKKRINGCTKKIKQCLKGDEEIRLAQAQAQAEVGRRRARAARSQKRNNLRKEQKRMMKHYRREHEYTQPLIIQSSINLTQ